MMRQKFFIDSHKAANAIAVLALMAWAQAWDNPTAWLYLALHGTYGLLWILKSRAFPDRSWEAPCSLLYGLLIWIGLSLYWVTPWWIVHFDVRVGPAYAAGCVALYAIGVFLHFSADMQKHTSLALRPGALIQEGLWARIRNPNYLGELFIYLGFGLLAQHWVPLIALAIFVSVVWIPNMLRKDRSLARYPEFESYRERSWLFLPPFW
jgi:protein-S-isoprenylcysteine O-methyltransferase Ste14